MKHFIFSFTLLILLFSCKSDKKTETPNKATNSVLTTVDLPFNENASLPRLFSNNKDLFFSWVEQPDSLAILKYAVLENGAWGTSEEIISGTDWFVNWADFPAIAESNGNILTNFLQKSDNGTYTYDVKLNLFNSEENTWKKNFILHSDGTKSEHGFVSMQPYVANSFVVTWLDGRETVGKEHGGGQMTLRAAIVFEDGSIDHDTLLDEKVCDCCQTATAIGANDQIIVAYRDRSDDEIRDISIVNWQHDKGWSEPQTIGDDNWKIPGCPVNGPSLATLDDSVAVAWFTSEGENPRVEVAFSEDNATTFGSAVRIDAGNAIGRVDLVMLNFTEAAVLWMESQGEDTVIQLQKVSQLGLLNEPITISRTSPKRASGFPQMELLNDKLYISWTDVSDKTSIIKMVSVLVESL